MIIPKNNRIYEYNNEKVIVWSQVPFKYVNYRTVPKQGGSIFNKANWFNFVFNAKFIERIKFSKYY